MIARALAVLAAAGLILAVAAPVSAQMPDPRMMSGQIMPSPDLPAGSVSVNREPLPGTLDAVIVPPMSRASRLAIARPRPAPPLRRASV